MNNYDLQKEQYFEQEYNVWAGLQDIEEPEINTQLAMLSDDELEQLQQQQQDEQQALQNHTDSLFHAEQEKERRREEANERYRNRITGASLAELFALAPEQEPFIVQDILPQGLGLIFAPPKYGKSFLVGQMCLAVSSGTPFLGHETTKGRVLYLALEDTPSGSYNRFLTMMTNLDLHRTPLGQIKCDIAYELSDEKIKAGETIYEKLENYILSNQDTKLIVIDTLGKVRSCDGTEYSYKNDTLETGLFKAIADKFGIAILLVHHSRKDIDEKDAHNNASGTTGLVGGVDTSMAMVRSKRDDLKTYFTVTGRKAKSTGYYIKFNQDTLLWEKTEEPIDPRIQELEKLSGKYYNKDIAKLIDMDEQKVCKFVKDNYKSNFEKYRDSKGAYYVFQGVS